MGDSKLVRQIRKALEQGLMVHLAYTHHRRGTPLATLVTVSTTAELDEALSAHGEPDTGVIGGTKL